MRIFVPRAKNLNQTTTIPLKIVPGGTVVKCHTSLATKRLQMWIPFLRHNDSGDFLIFSEWMKSASVPNHLSVMFSYFELCISITTQLSFVSGMSSKHFRQHMLCE